MSSKNNFNGNGKFCISLQNCQSVLAALANIPLTIPVQPENTDNLRCFQAELIRAFRGVKTNKNMALKQTNKNMALPPLPSRPSSRRTVFWK